MVRPDVIVVNPSSVDYPLWREVMNRPVHSDAVGRVIVVHYKDHKGPDYSSFIKGAMPDCTHVDIGNIPDGRDWRDVAVNQGLKCVKSEWVVFMEQDFIPTVPLYFFLRAGKAAEECDVVGWVDGATDPLGMPINPMTRFHPSFLMVNRRALSKTSKDFSAHTSRGFDHFGLFSFELGAAGVGVSTLPRIGLKVETDWNHWAGVTHNFHLVMQGQPPCYQVEEFKRFVSLSLAATVPQHPDFRALCLKCLTY